MTTGWEGPRHPAPAPAPPTTPPPTDWWRVFGIVLFVVIALAGLAFVAATLLFIVAVNSYGSNK